MIPAPRTNCEHCNGRLFSELELGTAGLYDADERVLKCASCGRVDGLQPHVPTAEEIAAFEAEPVARHDNVMPMTSTERRRLQYAGVIA